MDSRSLAPPCSSSLIHIASLFPLWDYQAGKVSGLFLMWDNGNYFSSIMRHFKCFVSLYQAATSFVSLWRRWTAIVARIRWAR